MGLAIIERTFTTKDIVDLVYPVGSIYMSAESTSPAEKWGVRGNALRTGC